uniref:Retrotransposon gag domain-containing protein n=1 Tax=Ananas comosus var. bracteatus TaxID=296719 RepID=A0A6V7NP39_ANACO|nr:unnamed protein product [Ananas comosus var. bracteatus]
MSGETVEEYLNRFKIAKIRCFMRMPESEFTKMILNGLYFKIKDYFEDKYFSNLFDLGVRIAQYEQFRKESENNRLQWSRYKKQSKGKEKSLIEEQSVQEEPSQSSESEESADEAEVYAAGKEPFSSMRNP